MSEPINTQLIDEALRLARFDPHSVPPPDTPILTIQGRCIGTLGNYVAFTGRPKVGKTLFLSAVLASAYTPYDIWDCKLSLPPGRDNIAYFDTEQSKYAFYRLMTRTKAHMGMDNMPSMVQSFLLRKFDPAIIIGMIERVLYLNPNISVAFIDGMLDLCRNFNDEREAFEVIQFLKRISEERDVLLIGVIHQSKRESYSLGHLGSAVDRYAESTLSIEKDDSKKFITLSAGLLRNTIDEFSPITIMWNGNDFERTDIDVTSKRLKSNDKPPEAYTETQHRYFLNSILPTDGFVYDDLVQQIVEGKGVTKIKAKGFISHYIKNDLIYKGKDKLYRQTNSKILHAVKTVTA
jgi:hypothetical protein